MENEKIDSNNNLSKDDNLKNSEDKFIKKNIKNKNKKSEPVIDDEKQPDFIMIDMSYFIFYRYYALLAWRKLAKPDEPLENPIDNKEFVYKFNQTFVDKITEIPKKLKLKNFIYIAGLDCPKKNIWRNKLFDKYKEQRIYDDEFLGGPFFKIGLDLLKELNIPALKYDTFEADDCIAIMTKNILSKDVDNTIYIIANDMDYLQLAGPKVKIVNLKYKFLTDNKNCSGNPEKDLFCKIIMGDKSDNIKPVFSYTYNKIIHSDSIEYLSRFSTLITVGNNISGDISYPFTCNNDLLYAINKGNVTFPSLKSSPIFFPKLLEETS